MADARITIATGRDIDALRAELADAKAAAKKAEGWARRRARDLSQARAALAGIRTVVSEYYSSFDVDAGNSLGKISAELHKLDQAALASGGVLDPKAAARSEPEGVECFIPAASVTMNFAPVDPPTMAEYGALIRNSVADVAAQTDTPMLTGWVRIDDSPPSTIADHPQAAAKQNVAQVRSGFAGVRGGIRAGALAELGNYMRWIVELLPNEGDHLTISAKTFRELALEADGLLVDRELQKDAARTANTAADALQQQAESASTQRDAAYTDRARLVAFLAALYPSRITAVDSPEWPIATVLTPAGQMTWHISGTDVHLFAHVPTDADPTRQGDLWAWDSHTTDTKHERLALLTQLTDRLRKETTHEPRIWAAGIGHVDQVATPGYATTPDGAQEQTP